MLVEKRLNEEKERNKEVCLWISFCDTSKPDGEQFLGVVVRKALGLAHAIRETHILGINPGGEVQAVEVDPNTIDEKDFNRLLSKKELIVSGYID